MCVCPPAGMEIARVTFAEARPSPPHRVHHSCRTMPVAPQAGQATSSTVRVPAPGRVQSATIAASVSALLRRLNVAKCMMLHMHCRADVQSRHLRI